MNTVELNFTGHPGVSVPIGISPEGVPIGMQIVAPRFGDRLALGLAAALEAAATVAAYRAGLRTVRDRLTAPTAARRCLHGRGASACLERATGSSATNRRASWAARCCRMTR